MELSTANLFTLENGTIVAESRCTLTMMEFIGTALQLAIEVFDKPAEPVAEKSNDQVFSEMICSLMHDIPEGLEKDKLKIELQQKVLPFKTMHTNLF